MPEPTTTTFPPRPSEPIAAPAVGQDNTAAAMMARALAHAHAVHQDSLLQAYRVLTALMHLAFLGTFAVLASVQLPFWLVLAVALPLVFVQHGLSERMLQMAHARQRDVDWSQKQVLLLEQALAPEHRTFTEFKLHQDQQLPAIEERLEKLLSVQPASEEQIERYFGKHASVSRSKASRLLVAMQRLGALVAALAVLAALLR